MCLQIRIRERIFLFFYLTLLGQSALSLQGDLADAPESAKCCPVLLPEVRQASASQPLQWSPPGVDTEEWSSYTLVLFGHLLVAALPYLVLYHVAPGSAGDTTQFCPLSFITQNSWQCPLWRAASFWVPAEGIIQGRTCFFLPPGSLFPVLHYAQMVIRCSCMLSGGRKSKGIEKQVGKTSEGSWTPPKLKPGPIHPGLCHSFLPQAPSCCLLEGRLLQLDPSFGNASTNQGFVSPQDFLPHQCIFSS